MADPSGIRLFAPRRELGRTGFRAAILGIGDVADRKVPLEQCVATLRRAMDAGANVIDTAPSYEDGYSELIVGQALRDGRRDGMFVIDKVDFHDDPVAPQIDASLTRLKLENTDLFLLHGLSTLEGWHRATAPGGAMEQLDKCIDAGKTCFRGISSHDPDVLKEALASGLCDVVMFPIGAYVDPRYVTEVLPLAKARAVGTIGIKCFGAGKLLGDTTGYNQPLQARPRGKISSGGTENADALLPRLTVQQCVNYTLTCDPDVALIGMSFTNEQDAAFAAIEHFVKQTPAEMEILRARAAEAIKEKGRCWWNPGGK